MSAFGSGWPGFVSQPRIPPSDFGETEIPPWTFQLQADHLDAAELDRWIGPRARPSWLQRLLPPAFGGAPAPEPPSVVLQRIRASGSLRVDELTIERIRLQQFRAQAKLDALKLRLQDVQAQWCGGEVKGALEAGFSAKPRYQMSASFERVAIAQTPWLAQLSSRLAGLASGHFELRAAGVGHDALLGSLEGKGEIRLANVELRGWDVAGTLALGEWKTGTSHWAAGDGTFHLSDGGFELNGLRLTSASGDFLLKGSVSFSENTDLTAESRVAGRIVRPQNTIRFMQISGPLAGPKVSLQKATARSREIRRRTMQIQPRSSSNRLAALIFNICLVLLVVASGTQAQQSFTLEQVMSAPFPSDLTAAKSSPRVAWVLDEQGKRNIFVAEAPDFKARRLTSYFEEDGQELSSLQFSADANTIVFTRGREESRRTIANPTSNPAGAEEAVYQISWRGGDPQKIDAGHDARISKQGICAYLRDGGLWLAPLGGKEKPEQLAESGTSFGQRWSPDGNKLAFVSGRGDPQFHRHLRCKYQDSSLRRSQCGQRFRCPVVSRRKTSCLRAPASSSTRHAKGLFHLTGSCASVGHPSRRRRDLECKRNLAQRQRIA